MTNVTPRLLASVQVRLDVLSPTDTHIRSVVLQRSQQMAVGIEYHEDHLQIPQAQAQDQAPPHSHDFLPHSHAIPSVPQPHEEAYRHRQSNLNALPYQQPPHPLPRLQGNMPVVSGQQQQAPPPTSAVPRLPRWSKVVVRSVGCSCRACRWLRWRALVG